MGRLVAVQGLSEVQEAQYLEPTVLLVQHIGGEEDIAEVNRLHIAHTICNDWLCVLHTVLLSNCRVLGAG